MTISVEEFRTLRVGDIVNTKNVMHRKLMVCRGEEHTTVDGRDNPHVVSVGLSHIWPWEVESITRFEDSGFERLPYPASKLYTLGDPLFVNDEEE